jgi:molybdopterin-guanine dinucleotide biosynthesis protein A
MGGGDKALMPFRRGPLIGAVIARIAPQAGPLAINANGDPARFAAFALPVLADPVPGHPGPLAGVLAAMDWAEGRGARAVLTVPCDTPFLPGDLVIRLSAVLQAGPAVAADGSGLHPTVALWPVGLKSDLAAALAAGHRRIGGFARDHGATIAAFGGSGPFRNINRPADLAATGASR